MEASGLPHAPATLTLEKAFTVKSFFKLDLLAPEISAQCTLQETEI